MCTRTSVTEWHITTVSGYTPDVYAAFAKTVDVRGFSTRSLVMIRKGQIGQARPDTMLPRGRDATH